MGIYLLAHHVVLPLERGKPLQLRLGRRHLALLQIDGTLPLGDTTLRFGQSTLIVRHELPPFALERLNPRDELCLGAVQRVVPLHQRIVLLGLLGEALLLVGQLFLEPLDVHAALVIGLVLGIQDLLHPLLTLLPASAHHGN